MNGLKRIGSDPLTHFLAIGAAILLMAKILTPSEPLTSDARRIEIDRETLLTYLQYRSSAFEQDEALRNFAQMTEADRQELIADYVRHEVLLREAKALGLDESDGVIKGRLQQRMEFALRGLVAGTDPIGDEDVTAYFQENIETYRIAPSITFTHVYVSTKDTEQEAAREKAEAILNQLKTSQVENPAALGDRFPYFVNYVERRPDFIASHFGTEFASKVFESKVAETHWQGPYPSPYGLHLVQITDRKPSRLPKLEEVRSRVVEDATREAIDTRLDMAIEELAKGYQIDIDLSAPDGSAE